MAVIISKKLHKHALPVIILSVGLLIVSIMVINHFTITTTTSNNNPTQLLSSRLFTIRPAANGLFHISRYEVPGSQESVGMNLINQTTTGLAGLADAGKVAELNVIINDLEQQ